MRSMNASRRDLLSSKMDFSQMMNCAASVPALPVTAMNGSAWDNPLLFQYLCHLSIILIADIIYNTKLNYA